jgi:hypothetical protein
MQLMNAQPRQGSFVSVLVFVDPANNLFAVGTGSDTLPVFLPALPGMKVIRNGAVAKFEALQARDIVQVIYDLQTGIPLVIVAVGNPVGVAAP